MNIPNLIIMKAQLENYSTKVIKYISGMSILASYKSYRWSSAGVFILEFFQNKDDGAIIEFFGAIIVKVRAIMVVVHAILMKFRAISSVY